MLTLPNGYTTIWDSTRRNKPKYLLFALGLKVIGMTEKLLAEEYMDQSVRPQDDLYRYVNGKWIENHEIPADRPSDGAFYALRDESEVKCNQIAKACDPASKDHDEALIGLLYQAFMDEDAVEAAGISPLEPYFEKIATAQTHQELAQVFGELNLGFFSFGISADPSDPTKYVPMLYQEGISLPDESYYREEAYEQVRQAFRAHVQKMAQLAEFEDPAAFAQTVWKVESTIAASHWNIVDCRDVDKTNNTYQLPKFMELAGGFDWNEWFTALSPKTAKIQEIRVYQPSFFQDLGKLWTELNLQDWKTWAKWQILSENAPLLSRDFALENFNFFSKTLAGTQQQRPRWKRAVGLVEGAVGEALGKRYVEKHFPPAYKQMMEQLVADLIEAYRRSISELTWMGEETRQRALEKLSKFTPKIAYPEKWRDYSQLDLTDASLVEMNRRCELFELNFDLDRLGKEVDRSEWLMTPQTVNAYYYPVMNEIVFPAAILQPPFFDPNADEALNYGGIGAVIGHEIGHGFDDQGSKYDGDGRINDWWTPADRQRFEQQTKALIDQYDALSPAQLSDEHKVNGALTIGENIGDLGGLSISYKAWLIALERKGISDPAQAPQIEGVPAEQAFFFAWAKIWRAKMHDELAIMRLATDPHSPNEFRCNQVVSNLDAFAQAFDLKPTDKLWRDETQRVRIW